jgi:hypothetical protein
MAIDRIEDINIDDTTLRQDGVGGGGGTSPTGGTNLVGTPSNNQNNTLTNLFIFNISSNEGTFTTLLNGEAVGDNKRIRITRDTLSRESKKIEVKKNGYSNNEYYLIEMVDDGLPIIDNPKIEQPLGLNTKDIVLTKYTKTPNKVVGTPISIKNEVSSNLSFTFNKLRGGDEYEEPKSYTSSFNVSGKGSPISVLKNGNKKAEFFIKSGASTYSDVEGTKYTISSSDLSLYRITNIIYTSNNQEKELVANDGESLQITVNLNSDYIFDIITEEVKQPSPALDPQIELVKTDARTYNLSSKTGVPLMFRKNADVQAITVIVGDDVLEFDDLDAGNLCGITIPHNVFDKIGKYNVKIFPFSFDDYEQQVRPAEKGDTIRNKPVETKFDVREEVKLPPIDVNDKYNPYSPKGSGGGGSRPITIDPIEEALNRTEEAFGVRDNSFVDRPVDNRNIR